MTRFRRAGRPLSSPFEIELAQRLDAGRSGEQPANRPLNVRSSPFALTAADYLKAAAGPPAWSARLARIEALRLELDQQLSVELAAVRERLSDSPDRLAAAWHAYVAALDLAPLNQLIAKHNDYYAIEAGLRMQWPSGRYLLPEGVEYPIEPLTVESLLARFHA